MTSITEYEWQREVEHPSTRALLSFLETDLILGTRLVAKAKQECFQKGCVSSRLLGEIERARTEITRWMACAETRKVQLGRLRSEAARLQSAIAELYTQLHLAQ